MSAQRGGSEEGSELKGSGEGRENALVVSSLDRKLTNSSDHQGGLAVECQRGMQTKPRHRPIADCHPHHKSQSSGLIDGNLEEKSRLVCLPHD